MWPWGDEMQGFKTLSYGDKLRVSRCLSQGEDLSPLATKRSRLPRKETFR
jgi:hypothetical protein